MRLGDDVSSSRLQTADTVRRWLVEHDLDFESPDDFTIVSVLPGEKKLRTTVSIVVGEHALGVDAFVMRHPDENVEAVHRWLLERNLKLSLVSYAIDHLGDVYLSGRLPLATVNADLLDTLFGQILAAADDPFNLLLEMGFESAITREWAWRLDRGESTANLAAFEHLRPSPEPQDG